MGISIIAACLPTLRPLFGELSLRSAVRSVRGIFLLPSFIASIFSRGKSSKSAERVSNASHERFAQHVPFHDVGTDIYAMRDVEAQHNLPPGKIMVHKNISHRSSDY